MSYRTSLPLHETEFGIAGPGERQARRRKRQAKRRMKRTQRQAKKQCDFRSKNPGCKQRRG